MKKLAVLACVLLMVGFLLLAGCGTSTTKEPTVDLEKVSEFEGGRLYKAGKIHVCQLNGDYKEMGRQYGELMKTQIKQFYDELVKALTDDAGLPQAQLEGIPKYLYEKQPARIKAVFEGMAETSGLELEELATCDSSEGLAMIALAGEAFQCSGIVAWGPYTGGGPLVFGRNFDYPEYFKEFDDTLTVVVFNPDDGSCSTATLANAGHVSAMNTFSDKGFVLEMNDATSCGDLSHPEDRMSPFTGNLTYFFDATNFETLDAELASTRQFHPFIINVANTKEAFCYETTTTETKRRSGTQEGLLVATNNFINPEWGLQEAQLPEWARAYEANSTMVRNNLIALGNKYKGEVDADAMKKIMDTKVEQGGATHSGTIYQFVAEPAELEMWVQTPGYQDWVLVEYGKFFD